MIHRVVDGGIELLAVDVPSFLCELVQNALKPLRA